MAKAIPRDDPRPSVNISDPHSRKSCQTLQVFDITDDCPQRRTKGKVFLMFARPADGMAVQFYYNRGTRSTHFLLSDIEEECLTPGGRFIQMSELLGLTARQLQRIVADVQLLK